MAAAIGAYSPAQGRAALVQVGALALGTVLAVAIAFLYSLHMVSRRGVPAPSPPPVRPDDRPVDRGTAHRPSRW